MSIGDPRLEGRATVRDDGTLIVSGVLTFATVPGVLASSVDWIAKLNGTASVDLGGVQKADSAGLALLVEWLQRARDAGRELRFVNVPEQVKSLIGVSGLSGVIDV